jgi:hypothetical protein
MKAYMAHSHVAQPCEGAILIFANSLKEAKKLAWGSHTFLNEICDEDYTDMRVKWLKGKDYIFEQIPDWSKELLKENKSHIVESPNSCETCHHWGLKLNKSGLCEECANGTNDYRWNY